MLRFHLFDSEPDDQSLPIDWRLPALIIATLFLNLPFWYVHGLDLPMFWAFPLYVGILASGALLITALFFIGPARAIQAAKRPLFGLVENSLGSIPAFGLRACAVLFLELWIANLIAVPLSWWSSLILRRDVSSVELGVIASAVLLWVFVTGLQSLGTSAKLALFTNKLGIAILRVLVNAFCRAPTEMGPDRSSCRCRRVALCSSGRH